MNRKFDVLHGRSIADGSDIQAKLVAPDSSSSSVERQIPILNTWMGNYMQNSVESLAWEISNCQEVCKARSDKTHPCHGVVKWQETQWLSTASNTSTDTGVLNVMHRPEAWTGDLENAPILFLSSNPSFDSAENFPTWGDGPINPSGFRWDQNSVVYFAVRRFTSTKVQRKYGATDGPTIRDADRTIEIDGSLSKKVNHWRWVRTFVAYILDKPVEEVSAHSDYVMTEMVHCKSREEKGVPEALTMCSSMWLEKIWKVSNAKLVVVAGAKTGVHFAKLYGDKLPNDWGSWSANSEASSKGRGVWPKTKSELQQWLKRGIWGHKEQENHTVQIQLGGKTRTVVYFARPTASGSPLSSPWTQEGLVDPSIIKHWRDAINGQAS